jgi:hypothetical protein
LVVLGPALLAATLAVLAHLLGLQGGDEAAQAYRVNEVRVYGLVLWDSGWYGGNLPLGYSVVFPYIGAAIGLAATSVASAAVAAYAFDRLVTFAWHSRTASWYFATSTLLQVTIGQGPFLTGEALGLLALLVLRQRHTKLAAGLVALSALCSPLAAVFTTLACVAWAIDRDNRLVPSLVARLPIRLPAVTSATGAGRQRGARRGPGPVAVLIPGGAALAVILAIDLIFPGTGPFPYPWASLLLTLLLCATFATPLVPSNPVLRWGAGLYAVAAVGAFVVPNAVGGNTIRLAQAIGVPILAGLLFLPDPAAAGATAPFANPRVRRPGRWQKVANGLAPTTRPRALRIVVAGVVFGGFAAWQWAPGLNTLGSPTTDAAASASFYQPVLSQILNRSDGPVRVEAVPTKDHWESTYLAPKVSLARGWERQLDLADNPLFYTKGALTPTTYIAWLRGNGVTWVALPKTTLDYASVAEGALLNRGVPGLTQVWSSPTWRLWRVEASPGMVSGSGRLVSLDPDHLSVQVNAPSTLTVRVRYTKLWALASKDAGTATACVKPSPDGWTDVVATRAGSFNLAISVFDGTSANCPTT